MSSKGDCSDGKPKAKRNKVLKSNTNSPIAKKHKKNDHEHLIASLIKQQAEAEKQSRRVKEQLEELLNANKKHNIRKSKRKVVDHGNGEEDSVEDDEEEDSVVETQVQDINYNNKHNIRKSKRNELEEENETEEEESIEDDDGEVEDPDDAADKIKKSNTQKKRLAIKNRINNKYNCISYNDYEYMTRERDDFIEVKLPWLECSYDWKALIPDHQDGNNKKKKKKKLIPHDMFPIDNKISDDYGKSYFNHLYPNKDYTDDDISNCVEEIETLREHFKATIIEVLYKFWFDIAFKLGIYYDGNIIRDNKSLLKAFFEMDNRFDLNKMFVLLYLVFDWLNNYQNDIVLIIQRKHMVEVMEPPKMAHTRTGKNCVHLLITRMITNERQTINERIKAALNIQCFISRDLKQERKDNPGKEIKSVTRKIKTIHPYMIRGDFVSTCVLYCNIDYVSDVMYIFILIYVVRIYYKCYCNTINGLIIL
jgi:hypothetical protein